MNALKNKHLIIAMFVAPTLAILAYLGVDYQLSEKAKPAVKGQSYQLAAQSNCRYQSGMCTLKNGDIKFTLRAERKATNVVELTLTSEFPLQKSVLALLASGQEYPPVDMLSIGEVVSDASPVEYEHVAELAIIDSEKSTLRLAVIVDGVSYFAEISAVFVDFETGFSRDNFSN